MAATPFAEPSEELSGKLRSAIWHDLMVNAMIGNGNWLGSLWYNASNGDEAKPDLRLSDLQCGNGRNKLTCSFSLFRDGGAKLVMNQEAPDKLACNATFIRSDSDRSWGIKHIPPQRGGSHSQTTMKCRVAA